MRIFFIISCSLFVIGFLFKLLHLPGAALGLVFGSGLLVCHSLIYLLINSRTQLVKSFVFIVFAFASLYLMFRLLFWPGAQTALIAVVTTAIIGVIIMVVSKTKPTGMQLFVALYLGVCIMLGFVHSDRIYYFTNYNQLNQSPVKYPFIWDKYSWFLYLAGRKDEAAIANANAREALAAGHEDFYYETRDNEPPQVRLERHGKLIAENGWNSYP
jgi:hypothetical protein